MNSPIHSADCIKLFEQYSQLQYLLYLVKLLMDILMLCTELFRFSLKISVYSAL